MRDSTSSSLGEASFKQDANFLYLTGLPNQPSAILALDGPRKEARLFVPEVPTLFGARVEGAGLTPGEDSASRYGFSRVEAWESFLPYIKQRLSEGVRKLYTDEARNAESAGNPPAMLPVSGDKLLWRRSLEAAFPGVDIGFGGGRDTEDALGEVTGGSENPSRGCSNVRGGAHGGDSARFEPGSGQRPSEVAVVSACFEAGAVAPSFWPWTMSGPNAHLGNVVRSFFDYEHLDRTMKAGELVRMDVGCALGHYEGDVGRTVPVSGKFNANQRETLDLLVRAYRAGLSAMKAGVPLETVMERLRASKSRARAGRS